MVGMSYEERYEVLIFNEWSKTYKNTPIARASNGMVVMPMNGIKFGDIVFAKITRLAPLRYWKVAKIVAKLGTITKTRVEDEEMVKVIEELKKVKQGVVFNANNCPEVDGKVRFMWL